MKPIICCGLAVKKIGMLSARKSNLLAPKFDIYILAHPVCKNVKNTGTKKGSIMK
jgi:hypothetical protein